MKIKVLMTAIILGLALPVAADFVQIQEAHEVQLSELRLPQSSHGTVAFKPCSDCPYMVKRVTAETQWILDGKSMKLEKFRRGVADLTERDNTAVTVLHHLENDRVTKVSVHIFRPYK
jgi:hypothetical protein